MFKVNSTVASHHMTAYFLDFFTICFPPEGILYAHLGHLCCSDISLSLLNMLYDILKCDPFSLIIIFHTRAGAGEGGTSPNCRYIDSAHDIILDPIRSKVL